MPAMSSESTISLILLSPRDFAGISLALNSTRFRSRLTALEAVAFILFANRQFRLDLGPLSKDLKRP